MSRRARHLRTAPFVLVLGAAVLLPGHAIMACPSEPMVGSICMMATNFCPRGFMEANGQLLPISQYTALFSLLGTTYGGNGQTTFQLPNLQAHVPVGAGQQVPTVPTVMLGEQRGGERVTGESGAGAAAATMPLQLGIKFCIAVEGVYPPRD